MRHCLDSAGDVPQAFRELLGSSQQKVGHAYQTPPLESQLQNEKGSRQKQETGEISICLTFVS